MLLYSENSRQKCQSACSANFCINYVSGRCGGGNGGGGGVDGNVGVCVLLWRCPCWILSHWHVFIIYKHTVAHCLLVGDDGGGVDGNVDVCVCCYEGVPVGSSVTDLCSSPTSTQWHTVRLWRLWQSTCHLWLLKQVSQYFTPVIACLIMIKNVNS